MSTSSKKYPVAQPYRPVQVPAAAVPPGRAGRSPYFLLAIGSGTVAGAAAVVLLAVSGVLAFPPGPANDSPGASEGQEKPPATQTKDRIQTSATSGEGKKQNQPAAGKGVKDATKAAPTTGDARKEPADRGKAEQELAALKTKTAAQTERSSTRSAA